MLNAAVKKKRGGGNNFLKPILYKRPLQSIFWTPVALLELWIILEELVISAWVIFQVGLMGVTAWSIQS